MKGYAIVTNIVPREIRPLFTEVRLTKEQFINELKSPRDFIPLIGQRDVASHVSDLLNCSVAPYGDWDVRDLAGTQVYCCTQEIGLDGERHYTYHKYTPVENRG